MSKIYDPATCSHTSTHVIQCRHTHVFNFQAEFQAKKLCSALRTLAWNSLLYRTPLQKLAISHTNFEVLYEYG